MLATIGVEAEHLEVAREAARTDAPIESSLRHVVELCDAVSQHERVVVRHARDACAENDVFRKAQRLCDEQVGRGDVLPLSGEVLADPRLFVAKAVERDDLL